MAFATEGPVLAHSEFRPVSEIPRKGGRLEVVSDYAPAGDQPEAIDELERRLTAGEKDVVLLGGDSGATKGSSAQETAESFAAAFNDRNVEGIKSLLCNADRNGDPGRDLDSGKAFQEVPENGRVELAKVVEDGPGKAKAHYDRFIGDQREDNAIEVPLVEKDGVWEICVGGRGTR